ncbi:MAG: molybdopterin molybdotransferase MoeA [Propionibacteriaceae bacterium]
MALFGRKKTQLDETTEVPTTIETPFTKVPECDAAGRRQIADHRAFVLDHIDSLPAFGMKMLDAVGLRLYEDLQSFQNIPKVDVAHSEGYAVAASDLSYASADRPVTLAIAGEISFGQQATGQVESGECVRLVAGAPLPSGTDAVIGLSQVSETIDEVVVTKSVVAGQGVRVAGSDITASETLLRKGDRLDARIVGLLASAGIDRVMARPRPRVVVLATGTGLVEPGESLTHDWDSYDATSYLLAAAVRDLGAEVYRVGEYSCDEEKLKEAISDQLIRADLVITTGGISGTGDDILMRVLPAMGHVDFADIAMSPGGRQGFALVGPDEIPLLALSSDAVAAFVAFHAFVRPAIHKMMGIEPWADELIVAQTSSTLTSAAGEATWLRGKVQSREEVFSVTALSEQPHHRLADLAQANCLIFLQEGTTSVAAGENVHVLMLDRT